MLRFHSSVLCSFAKELLQNARLVTSIVKMSFKAYFSTSLGIFDATITSFTCRRLFVSFERVDTLVIEVVVSRGSMVQDGLLPPVCSDEDKYTTGIRSHYVLFDRFG